MSKRTGWEIDNRAHFDDIVYEYERIRPEWPDAIFDDIIMYMGAGGGKRALEIGAGTGKATRHMLNRGFHVTAVEIGANMCEYIARRFAGNDDFSVIQSSFEAAELAENAYDIVYAASAFHWVDASVGCPKARALLDKGGVFALFRYNEIASLDDPVYMQISEMYKRHYCKYSGAPYRPPVERTHADLSTEAEILRGFRFKSMQDYGFGDVTMRFYDAYQTYDADGYIEFLNTLADHRNMSDSARKAFHGEIARAIRAHGDSFTQKYTFQLYMGRV